MMTMLILNNPCPEYADKPVLHSKSKESPRKPVTWRGVLEKQRGSTVTLCDAREAYEQNTDNQPGLAQFRRPAGPSKPAEKQ